MKKTLSSYLSEERIVFLSAKVQKAAIAEIIERSQFTDERQGQELLTAILAREQIVSTGLGQGVAVPHVRLSSCRAFSMALGIASSGIDWNALDQKLVQLIFLICAPESAQKEYLQVLSEIVRTLKDERKRGGLLSAKSASEVLVILES